MSKGLDYDESKKLIIMANFNKVINNIKEEYKNQIIDYLDKEI
jgi:Fe-S cluster assembly scaffold protein SufB